MAFDIVLQDFFIVEPSFVCLFFECTSLYFYASNAQKRRPSHNTSFLCARERPEALEQHPQNNTCGCKTSSQSVMTALAALILRLPGCLLSFLFISMLHTQTVFTHTSQMSCCVEDRQSEWMCVYTANTRQRNSAIRAALPDW